MTATTDSKPRVFVSYAWTSDEHRRRVVDIATLLRQSGVDAILDLWDLKPGQDKYRFMEQCVVDPSVKHVLLMCNQRYAERADARAGGVGDETQIITSEVYGRTEQTKFIPVVLEVDPDGKPCIPAYLRSRIHIDLTGSQEQGMEQLLRVVLGLPEHPKPPLGERPPHLVEGASAAGDENAQLAARVQAVNRRLQREYNRHVESAIEDVLTKMATLVADCRAVRAKDGVLDDAIVEKIASARPVRDLFEGLVNAWAQNAPTTAEFPGVNEFLERLLNARQPQRAPGTWTDEEFEPPAFLGYEMSLILVAELLRARRFDDLTRVITDSYLVRRVSGDNTRTFAEFGDVRFSQLDWRRRQRLRSNRVSYAADLLHERSAPANHFAALQEADFLLFLRARFLGADYVPLTLVYHERGRPFDIFAGAHSRRRFEILRTVLDVRDIDHLGARFEAAFPTTKERRWTYTREAVSYVDLMQAANLHVLLPAKFSTDY